MHDNRNFLIKPASGYCNMRCDYCFYADEMKERTEPCTGMMSEETARNLIDMAFSGLTSGSVSFAFQGGEPTTRGLDFFRYFTSYAKERADGTKVLLSFAIQTNGFVIDSEWAEFFRKEGYLVGLSMDGNGKIHDTYRHIPGGKGSFKYVFRAANCLKKAGVEFNILSTVNKLVSRNAATVYQFFKKNGFRHIQFIPCLDFIGQDRGSLPWSLDSDEYGKFLNTIFPLYYRDWANGDYVSIRYFDNLVYMMLGEPPEACGMSGCCSRYFVVEADGSIYPCDFYVLDDYKIGNVNDSTLESVDARRREIGFIQKSMKVEDECRKCPYAFICRGGCRRDREDFRTGELRKTYLCSAYKAFFSRHLGELRTMAQAEAEQRRRESYL